MDFEFVKGAGGKITKKTEKPAPVGRDSPVFHTAITPNFNIYLQISLYGCNICRVR